MSVSKRVAVKKLTSVTRKMPGKATSAQSSETAKDTPQHSRKAAITFEQRNAMIAEAAYYRSIQRGFADADPLADWLWAEAEIDKEP